jgi:hypothetical protein
LTRIKKGDQYMSEKDSTMDYLIAACAIAAALVPLVSLIPFHINGRGLFDWSVNLLCVAAFYFGFRRLLQKLALLETDDSDPVGNFHKIRVSVSRLAVVGLSAIAFAWIFSDYISH